MKAFALLCAILFPLVSSAQGNPEVAFQVNTYLGSQTPAGSYGPASSWNDSNQSTSGSVTYNRSASGSVSGNSIQLSTSASQNGSGISPSGTNARHLIYFYARDRGTYTVSGSHSASLSYSGPSTQISKYSFPWSQQLQISGTGSDSQSPSTSNSTITTTGCGTPARVLNVNGVSYPVLVAVNGQNIQAEVSSSAPTSQVRSGTANGSSTFTVTKTNWASPVAVLNGPFVGGVLVPEVSLGQAVTVQNASYDPDDGSTTFGTGLCSTSWKLFRPDGTQANSGSSNSGTGGVTGFTATIAGVWRYELTVTDNEGTPTTTELLVNVDNRVRDRSTSFCQSCGKDKSVLACVEAPSGNGKAEWSDPVATHGYPLGTRITISNQYKLAFTPAVIGKNASFTWGIKVHGGGTGPIWIEDADGMMYSYGSFASPVPQAGFFSQLVLNTNGVQIVNAGAPGEIWKSGNFTYDFHSNGHLAKITDPSGNVQEVSYGSFPTAPVRVDDLSTGKWIEFEYDTPGGFISRIVENNSGAVTHLTHDNTGRIEAIVTKDALGTTITRADIAYTGNGNLYQITRDNDLASTVTYSYVTGANVPLANITWQGGGTSLEYFATPATGGTYRVVQTNQKGGKTNYDYTKFGDLIRVQYPKLTGAASGVVYNLTYDANRNVTAVSNGATSYTMSYNSKGNLTQFLDGAGGQWNLSYATNGIDPISVTDTLGTILTYAYGDPVNPHSPL